MNWIKSADGLLKVKRNAERTLQAAGTKVRSLLTDKRTPEQKLKGGMKAYAEGGGGGRLPKLKDYK